MKLGYPSLKSHLCVLAYLCRPHFIKLFVPSRPHIPRTPVEPNQCWRSMLPHTHTHTHTHDKSFNRSDLIWASDLYRKKKLLLQWCPSPPCTHRRFAFSEIFVNIIYNIKRKLHHKWTHGAAVAREIPVFSGTTSRSSVQIGLGSSFDFVFWSSPWYLTWCLLLFCVQQGSLASGARSIV
jgi:hypothetical protein